MYYKHTIFYDIDRCDILWKQKFERPCNNRSVGSQTGLVVEVSYSICLTSLLFLEDAVFAHSQVRKPVANTFEWKVHPESCVFWWSLTPEKWFQCHALKMRMWNMWNLLPESQEMELGQSRWVSMGFLQVSYTFPAKRWDSLRLFPGATAVLEQLTLTGTATRWISRGPSWGPKSSILDDFSRIFRCKGPFLGFLSHGGTPKSSILDDFSRIFRCKPSIFGYL
jgi:hypothetical protein